MGELIEFGRGRRRDKKELSKEAGHDPDNQSGRSAYDDPNDEPLSEAEERRVQGNVASAFRENGLDTEHYRTITGLLKTLVAQIPSERKNRLRAGFVTVVRDYSMDQTIDFLNRATEHDLSVRPMFYDALVLKLDHARIELLRKLRNRAHERQESNEKHQE